jgi:hypothetical protein
MSVGNYGMDGCTTQVVLNPKFEVRWCPWDRGTRTFVQTLGCTHIFLNYCRKAPIDEEN